MLYIYTCMLNKLSDMSIKIHCTLISQKQKISQCDKKKTVCKAFTQSPVSHTAICAQ